jgi:hypothetical protein
MVHLVGYPDCSEPCIGMTESRLALRKELLSMLQISGKASRRNRYWTAAAVGFVQRGGHPQPCRAPPRRPRPEPRGRERESESSVFGSDEIHGLRIEKEEESEGGERKNREKRCEIFVSINYDSQIILTILLLDNADRRW